MKKLLLFIGILIAFYVLFMYTGLFMPKQKEVEQPKELAKIFIAHIIKKLPKENTLWLVNRRMRGVCGNDPMFDGVTTLPERMGEFHSLWNNPYVFNPLTAFEDDYKIGEKTIIVGEAFQSNFTSNSALYPPDTFVKFPPLYDIISKFIDKNHIEFSLVDDAQSDSVIFYTKMIFDKGTWRIQ